jgi:uncharacterized protein (TIGR03083 family)|tara:strand:- start:299 stop:1126 length:828 start_codon:yes stop_codon:yes gene_type:complete
MASPEQRIELVKSESRRIQQYLGVLSAEDMARPSACDAWEVGDVVAHLTAAVDLYEAAISKGITGDSNPPEGLSAAGVSSLMTRLEENTQRVINLRQDMGDQLLTAFSKRCEDLTQLLESLADTDWQKLCYHPGKVIPVATYVDLRLAELAIHEWDIRSKLDVSTELSALCLPAVMDFISAFVVGTMFRPGIGQTETIRFRFELTGTVPSSHDIVVENRNVHMESAREATPNVTFRCDTETFVLVAYGRISLNKAESEGRLTVKGDRELASLFSS